MNLQNLFYLFITLGVLSCTTAKQPSHPTAASNDKPHKYVRFSKFEGDSVKYLQTNFIENKERYIGEKFKKLLKDLQFEVKSYMDNSPSNNIFISTNLTITFYDFGVSNYRRNHDKAIQYLTVTWQTPVKRELVDKLNKSHDHSWSKAHAKFFGEQVVKKIYLSVYPRSERPEK